MDLNLLQLERDGRLLAERLKQTTEQLKDLQQTHNSSKAKWSQEKRELLATQSRMHEELTETKSSLRTMKVSYESQLASIRLQFSHIQEFSRIKQERIEELERLAETRLRRVKELESESVPVAPISTATPSNGEEYAGFLKKQLSEQMESMRSLESKNRALNAEIKRLQDYKGNIEMMNEENSSLKSRIVRMEKTMESTSNIATENMGLKDELDQWKMVLAKVFNETNREAITLQNFRSKLFVLRDSANRDMKAQHSADLLCSYNEALEKVEKLENQIKRMESSRLDILSALKMAESRLRISQKEVQSLRDQLKSYDLEEKELSPSFDLQKSMRIEHLESLVKELQDQLDSIMPASGFFDSIRNADKDKEIISQLNAEKLQLGKELELARNDLIKLEKAFGEGGYDMHRLRILQLANNPADQAFTKDQTINEGDMTKSNETSNELLKQLQSSEKRLQRLKEASELREAVSILLGFRIDSREDGFDILSSLAGDDTTKALRFTRTRESSNLQGTEFSIKRTPYLDSPEISNLFRYYVEDNGSIAAFLCDLNLRLWEKSQNCQRF